MKHLMIALALLGGAAPAAAQRWDGRERFEGRGDHGWRDGRDRRGGRNIRTFEAPRFGGLPLDICPRDVGVDGLVRGRCGVPVANEFCRSRGFAEALDAPHANAGGRTRFLSGDVVEHPWATTFRYITCER